MKTRKEKIIECGRKILVEKGYHGSSISVIAEDVGLKKSSVYSHFASKDEIVREALSATQIDIESCLKLTGDYKRDFRDTLENIIVLLQNHRKCIGLSVLYDYDESIGNIIKVQLQQFFHAFKQVLLIPLLQREWGDELVVENMVEDVISLLEGATIWIALSDNRQPLERVLNIGMVYLAQLDFDMRE